MKNTMNNRDIAKFHKYLLDEKIPNNKISAILKVDPATLKTFTPEAMAKAKAVALEKQKEAIAKRNERIEKTVVAMAAAEVSSG